MKRINLMFVCNLVLVTTVVVQAQPTLKGLLGDGIFVQGGSGHLVLRDNYISDERYSGSLPYFEVGWLKSHDSSAVRFSIEYRSSSDVRNNNVSADIIQAVSNLDYLYPVGAFPLFTHDVFAFLGPSTEMYIYFRNQNIASGGFAIFNAYSFALLLSEGINSEFIFPIGSSFSAEWSGRLDIIGFGGRMFDMHNSNEKPQPVKLVSIISGIRGSTNVLLRYNVSDVILLKAGYRLEICQSASWDYLLSASDNLILVISYRI